MSRSSASPRTLPNRASRAARRAAGKVLRSKVPRSGHSYWSPPRDRVDPVELLAASDRVRAPALLPIRYERMSLSSFAFLRGAAVVMAHDLATTPVTGLRVQMCGDAHVGNFGFFATPERDQVFDLDDFDETLVGPWEWDVKRLGVSLVLAARGNRYGRTTARDAARAAVASYRTMMARFARMRYLDTWYFHLDQESQSALAGSTPKKLIDRAITKARQKTSLHAFPKLAQVRAGRARIRDDPPLIVHYPERAALEESRSFYDRYLSTLSDERRMLLDRYQVADVAQKVVGVGSVGLACSVILLLADSDVVDPLFLQIKQATESALEGVLEPSPYENHAERVVVGQRMIQEASDAFLGWSRLRSRDFYVRQLWDMKFSYDISTLGPRELVGQAELCGTALARAHARTGDPARISGYLGKGDAFDEAVTRFAEAYADQTERDYEAMLEAIRKGRLPGARSGAKGSGST